MKTTQINHAKHCQGRQTYSEFVESQMKIKTPESVTNIPAVTRQAEIEQDERDIQRIRRHKEIGLRLMFMFGIPALVVFLAWALGGQ